MKEQLRKTLYRQACLMVVMIFAFGCGYVVDGILRFYHDFKHQAVFGEIARTFFVNSNRTKTAAEKNGNVFVPQSPEIISRILLQYDDIHATNDVSDPSVYRIADWLASHSGVFRLGTYVYFSVDSDGNRICWDKMSPSNRKIVLLDTRPLNDGSIMYMYNDGSVYGFTSTGPIFMNTIDSVGPRGGSDFGG